MLFVFVKRFDRRADLVQTEPVRDQVFRADHAGFDDVEAFREIQRRRCIGRPELERVGMHQRRIDRHHAGRAVVDTEERNDTAHAADGQRRRDRRGRGRYKHAVHPVLFKRIVLYFLLV